MSSWTGLTTTVFSKLWQQWGSTKKLQCSMRGSPGRSPTILRRRLSKIPTFRIPRWAKEEVTARRLVPIALAGAWNGTSAADRGVLTTMADQDYEELEVSIRQLLLLDDSPVWSTGQALWDHIETGCTVRNWQADHRQEPGNVLLHGETRIVRAGSGH